MKSDILTIGPGLGENCNELVYDLILNSDSPIILDADGINAFANKIDLLKSHKSLLLITPHLKEYSRLFPNDFIETLDPLKKIDLLKQRSIDLNATILLKGATTIITDPYGNCFINDNGNSALATAGSGDVLTGIITGIAAQILKSHNNKDLLTNAAIISAHLHCIAGNLASEKLSEYSVIARDIVNNIPISFKTLLIDT
jgi:NAD(P)H-hydrate epimerase